MGPTQESKLDHLLYRLRLPRFSVAFQPIYDVQAGRVHAYEALVRGYKGECYPQLTAGLKARSQRCLDRVAVAKALRFAANHREARAGAKITVNLRPSLRRAKADAEFVARRARRHGIDPGDIILELTETVKINCGDLKTFRDAHESAGFCTAIDDFGAGYAGLSLLADCLPGMLKLDRALTTGIDKNEHRQKIVGGFVSMCEALGTEFVAEGVETPEEYWTLKRLGVRLMQGYLLARPGFERFPVVQVPAPPVDPEESIPSVVQMLLSGFEGLLPLEGEVVAV